MQFDDRSFDKPQLILKALRHELTPEEETELESWMQEDERNRLLMESLMNEAQLREEARFFAAVDAQGGWQKVMGKAEQRQQQKRKWRTSITRWQYAAAIAGLLALSWGAWQWTGKTLRPNGTPAVTSAAMDNIRPGGHKATLTLYDGSVVELEKAGEGSILQKQGIRVSKQGEEVVYEAAPGNGTPTETAFNTITTPRGGQYRIVLPDGSSVWLNAASTLRFPATFTASERSVELKGEAYFEIARDARRPFRVKVAGLTEVEVLGTHFNIMAYEERTAIRTTLLEGAVKVTPFTGTGAASVKLLRPGQQARLYNAATLEVGIIDPDEAVAWKNGLFRFNDDDIRSVMSQIARWYDVDVRYEGELPITQFTGMISRNAGISQVLNMLERTGGVKFSIEGRTIIVKK